MRGYIAFTKKEIIESIKSRRFFILFGVFLLFGIASPFIAKFTPEILSALAADMEMNTEPTAVDAWQQFYKNLSGVGISAFIILYGSCLSGEYAKGTLILMLTKGLSRRAVILSKYTASALFMTISLFISVAAACLCTVILWNEANLPNTALSALALWLGGILYLSILILGCVIFRQAFTSILFTGAIAALISLLTLSEPLAKFSPFILTTKNAGLISGAVSPSNLLLPAIVSIALSLLGLLAAAALFSKKQL